jgi:hypothetical protein
MKWHPLGGVTLSLAGRIVLNGGDCMAQKNAASISITDYRVLVRQLNNIDPKLYKDLRSDMKRISKPMAKAVRSSIPKTAPLGQRKDLRRGGSSPGFVHSGRLAWGKAQRLNIDSDFKFYPAASVYVQTPRLKKPKLGKTRSILRVRVNNAATVMADMAGRAGKYKDGGFSREHEINLFGKGIVKRRYRVNGQGRGLVANLDRRYGRKASHFAWGAAEKTLPATQSAVVDRINVSILEINRVMRNG